MLKGRKAKACDLDQGSSPISIAQWSDSWPVSPISFPFSAKYQKEPREGLRDPSPNDDICGIADKDVGAAHYCHTTTLVYPTHPPLHGMVLSKIFLSDTKNAFLLVLVLRGDVYG